MSLVIAGIRLRREARPTEVGRDNHVVFDECARQMTPHVARCAEAVQHNDRWTMTADPHMDGSTVGFDRPRLHHSREGINPIYVRMLAHLCTPGLPCAAVPPADGVDRSLGFCDIGFFGC